MKKRTFQTEDGWYVILVWDESRDDWSLWWSGSKKREDMERELAKLEGGKR